MSREFLASCVRNQFHHWSNSYRRAGKLRGSHVRKTWGKVVGERPLPSPRQTPITQSRDHDCLENII